MRLQRACHADWRERGSPSKGTRGS
jgi:hypothetical protein